MDPRVAKNILDIVGAVGTSLHKDVIAVENILLSIEYQSERMQEVVDRLKHMRNGILSEYAEEGVDAEEFILSMGHALIPLTKATTRLEVSRDSLKLTLDNMKATERAANRFANTLPAVPKV